MNTTRKLLSETKDQTRGTVVRQYENYRVEIQHFKSRSGIDNNGQPVRVGFARVVTKFTTKDGNPGTKVSGEVFFHGIKNSKTEYKGSANYKQAKEWFLSLPLYEKATASNAQVQNNFVAPATAA